MVRQCSRCAVGSAAPPPDLAHHPRLPLAPALLSAHLLEEADYNIVWNIVSRIFSHAHASLLLLRSTPEIAYYELQEVFSKERATHLPPHHHWDCAIDLLPNTMPPKCKVYPLSLTESKAMEDYIEEALAAGYIQPSTSPAATSSLWKCYYEMDLIDWYVIVYIDDILIYSSSFNDHVHHVRTVPTCLHQHQLYAKAEKCEFHKDSFTFL
ncbi:hypothetical protein QTP70_003521 [Hemibagrus guttatus]|uniref:ribonuclease H n=1 Tax=Hemibagrus guttatus TaxID=175788 RepID=A0AAE0RFN8_9TELE|nr:hypothetical protein QTP70_003521 [Hemibagrus guttatus]